jgi:demethylmenaquinone methyltransferase/2-methoxy-6-polyprenyl-1,4-benzoquinol methylase
MTTAPSEERADGGARMFDCIAERYDLLNRVLSLGLDRRWRRKLVQALGELDEEAALDVATGTADVAIAIARRHPGARVVGLDPSEGMLAVGRDKVKEAELDERIELVAGRAEALPFPDATFAATSIAFGIRNVPDRLAGLSEMRRVTRPGGVVAVLELSEPRAGILSPLARAHLRRAVPRIGAWLSGAGAYQYLRDSIAAFPTPEGFAELLAEADLEVERIEPFAFGAAQLFVARVV